MVDVAERLSTGVVVSGDDSGDEASEEEDVSVHAMSLKDLRKEVKRNPPLIRFFLDGEREQAKRPGGTQQLYFKVSGPSSRAVRHAFRRLGFIQTQGDSWNGLWGRLGNVTEYKELDCYQKVNHFPGTHELGRKDCLHKNISKMRRRIGSLPLDENDILPRCFLLPADNLELQQEMAANPHNIYVVKPPASSRGRGIKLASSIGDIPKEKKSLVQRYVTNPLLIDGYKFDLRIYVCVTSFDPLRIYIYSDGLGRFCTEKYKKGEKFINKRYMHLTNYSLQKNRANFVANKDAERDDEGSKWSLKAVIRRLREMGVDTSIVMNRIKDLVIRTIISVESKVSSMMQTHVAYPQNCYECFGFDVLLDETLRPWLVEVNTSPSLSSDSPLDKSLKTKLVVELFNLVGFRQYDRKTYKKDIEERRQARLLGFEKSAGKRPISAAGGISSEQKAKRRECLVRGQSPLENLSPEDLDMIAEAEGENVRSKEWERIFPSPASHLYDKLFEYSRYSNMLLSEWVRGKGTDRTRAAISDYVSEKMKTDFKFDYV
uniref:Tubulin--tyrosine ligase-like protein 5 n=1 Tax=Palpitomonas bilix TaxID=652834 RepID=A0A7S3GKS6_9EUKA|mmetsp:Transcript_7648/g.19840  ORF Transcript_7648/g.19840 Transcript_7648/m.19840 type:complete len:544 (+) Transcript_7648:523-2154(+)